MEPRLEPVGIPQGGEVAPGGDERLLGGVLGPPVVTEDQAGRGVESADRVARANSENAS